MTDTSPALSPATDRKQICIRQALQLASYDLPPILAMLTSPVKDERERGKRLVREIANFGMAHIERQRIADDLRRFADRHDPDQIAP